MCMHFAICNFHLADKFEKISMTEEDRFSKVNGEQLLLEPSTGTGGKPQAGPGAGAGRAAVSAGVTGCSVQARAQRAADAAVLWAAAPRDSVLPLGKGRATPEGALATHRAGRTGRLLPRTGRLHTRTCTGPSRGAGRCLGALRASGTIENLKTLICWVFWLHVKGNKI